MVKTVAYFENSLAFIARKNLRKTVEGILFRLRTGCQWADIPSYFGKANSLYQSFNRWSKRGIFTRLSNIWQIHPIWNRSLWTVAIIRVHNMVWVNNPLRIKLLVRVFGGHTSKIHLAV